MFKSVSSRRYILLKLSAVVLVLAVVYYQSVVDISSDLFFDTPDFIRKYGYPVESHVVQSEDGYLTTIHRIPHGRKNDTGDKNKPAVLIQHGIMCSSDTWVYSGPDTDLPFILADKGYDVWLGNSRGNHYADRHANTSLEKEKYWDFSWHEMGHYDIPAIIDHILQTSGQEQLYYIGHSMGTTMFFVMASTRPEYNGKVKMMIALAPVTHLDGLSTVTQNILVPLCLGLGEVMKAANKYQILPRSPFRTYLINLICKDYMPTHFICRQLAFGIAGDSYEQFNSSAISVIFAHVPAGSSENQVLHFYQTMKTGRFLQMDLGTEENLRRYNQRDPPEYDLQRVTTPISVYYAENDALATVETVQRVASQLPRVVKMHKIPLATFNHFDFAWGKDVNKLLYQDVVADLEQDRAVSQDIS